LAIHKPYDAADVFATSEEALRAGTSVTDIPLSVFQDSFDQPEIQEMVRAAARMRPDGEADLSVFS
jgi:hypothetical protein